MITLEQLAALTGGNPALAAKWLEPLNAAMPEFNINTPARVAMFLAQLAHESAGFAITEESLFYRSADRLRAVWPSRFSSKSDAELAPLLKNPHGLASLVYAGRMGNGDVASADGWNYRGRGLIQLTGLDNHRAASIALGIDFVVDPDSVADPDNAARVAAWFWQENGCNELADASDYLAITRRINGGTNGQQDRFAKLAMIQAAMAA